MATTTLVQLGASNLYSRAVTNHSTLLISQATDVVVTWGGGGGGNYPATSPPSSGFTRAMRNHYWNRLKGDASVLAIIGKIVSALINFCRI